MVVVFSDDELHRGDDGDAWVLNMDKPDVVSIQEMAELEAKATPGPWTHECLKFDTKDEEHWVRIPKPGTLFFLDAHGDGTEPQEWTCSWHCETGSRNGAFIAASRTFVPWAIARIAQLEAEAAKWNKAWHEQRVTTGEAYWKGRDDGTEAVDE